MFTDEQYAFLKAELGCCKSEVDLMSEDDLFAVFDQCQEIEVSEAATDTDSVSDRCRIAADICDVIYNPGATPEGIAEYEADMEG